MSESSSERSDINESPDAELQRVILQERRIEILEYWEAAAIMCLDSDMRIFQRFGQLRIFLILRLQHRLQAMTESLGCLESKRNQMDSETMRKDRTLAKLNVEIEDTLKVYDSLLLSTANINKLKAPSERFLIKFIRFWRHKLTKIATDLGVNDSRGNPDAVTAIDAEEKSWTHTLVDQSEFLQKLFNVKEKTLFDVKVSNGKGHRISETTVKTYSESKIRRAQHIFVNVSFSVMLLCPIIALSFIGNETAKLAIVLVFLLFGAILTSGIISNTNDAGLAVLAGYGAILVFFLGTKTLSSS